MSTLLASPLRRGDFLLLAAYCLVLFGFAIYFDRTLSTHETVHCVNIREMLFDGDWIIPHYGARPWLERPPLPFWLTMPVVTLAGDIPAAYRLAPLGVAIGCVLLVSWMASVWYGRTIGLLAGLILATIREFTHYATAPECDMFLCGVVTLALALFVRLEFCLRPSPGESGHLLGTRPWNVLAFFVVLGMTNLVKGLFFGDVFVLLPVAGYLLLGGQPWSLIKRYMWFWGWLAFALTACAWALPAYLRHPDIVELWNHDYAGRMNQGYMREPFWYYFAHMPWVLFPWTLAASIGLVASLRALLPGAGRSPERFLVVWAVAPILLFTIPQGKHHHYMLHELAPWAVLAALGMVRMVEWLPRQDWMRTPWPALLVFVVPGEIGLYLAGHHLGNLAPWLPLAFVAWPLTVLLAWWICTQSDLQRAAVAVFALLIPLHWFGHAFLTLVDDRYAADRVFVREVQQRVPAESRVLVLNDIGPLDASWMLFYLEGRARLLHNPSFLKTVDPAQGEVFLITRRMNIEEIAAYGRVEPMFLSRRTRDEREPGHRFGLFRLQVHGSMQRHTAGVYISPMQATGRAPGPVVPD